jgi:hypothetical protein
MTTNHQGESETKKKGEKRAPTDFVTVVELKLKLYGPLLLNCLFASAVKEKGE